MSRRLRLLLSALCAVAAMVACALYGNHVRSEADQARSQVLRRYGGDTVELVVADRAIEAGEMVSMADVQQLEWISSLAPEDAITSMDDVLGREVSVPVAANAPLCELNFRQSDQHVEVPSGRVAVSVPITDRLGIADTVEAGSHVVAYRVSDGATDLVAADAIVLAAPISSSVSMGKGMLTIAVGEKDVSAILETSTAGDLRLVVPASDVRMDGEVGARVAKVEPVEGVADGKDGDVSEDADAQENGASSGEPDESKSADISVGEDGGEEA